MIFPHDHLGLTMTSVRTRFVAALIALAPAAGLLAAGSPAQAATSIKVKSVSVSTSTVVIGSASTTCKSVTFKAKLNKAMPNNNSKVGLVGADLYGPGKDLVGGTVFKRVGKTLTYKGKLEFCAGQTLGKYRAVVYGAILSENNGDIDLTNKVKKYISLKRPSKLTLDAAPEPIAKGEKLTATGTLTVDGKALAGAKVAVYFKAKGAKAYKLKVTTVTNAEGGYSKTFTAAKTGTWKVEYAGSGTRNKAAATDIVTVTS
jgi:hypothetical protein